MLDTWFLVGFNHHDRKSRALGIHRMRCFQCWQMHPPLFSASLCRFTRLNPLPPLLPAGRKRIIATSLPLATVRCLSPSAAVWQSSAHPILPIHWNNFLPITLETKDKTAKADFFFLPLSEAICAMPRCDTRHLAVQTHVTHADSALAHVISSLMHQGKASALQWGLSPSCLFFFKLNF